MKEKYMWMMLLESNYSLSFLEILRDMWKFFDVKIVRDMYGIFDKNNALG